MRRQLVLHAAKARLIVGLHAIEHVLRRGLAARIQRLEPALVFPALVEISVAPDSRVSVPVPTGPDTTVLPMVDGALLAPIISDDEF